MPGIHHFNCVHYSKYSLFSSGSDNISSEGCPTLIILLVCIHLNILSLSLFRKWQYKQYSMPNTHRHYVQVVAFWERGGYAPYNRPDEVGVPK
jgi:hypothetical protein